jgi:hypothetical protein
MLPVSVRSRFASSVNSVTCCWLPSLPTSCPAFFRRQRSDADILLLPPVKLMFQYFVKKQQMKDAHNKKKIIIPYVH